MGESIEVEISAVPAVDEDLYGSEMQQVLQNIQQDLQAQGCKTAVRMQIHDSADIGGVWSLGQFTIEFSKVVVPPLATVFGAYLVARVGRKVRLETPDGTKIEAHNIKELEEVLRVADERRQKQLPPPTSRGCS